MMMTMTMTMMTLIIRMVRTLDMVAEELVPLLPPEFNVISMFQV